MQNKTNHRVIAWMVLGAAVALISGCASSRSGNVYTRDQARQAHKVADGVVASVRPVTIEDDEPPLAGTVAGGLAGGVLGATLGSGSGRDVATVMGALIGAGGGAALEKMMGKKDGLEITVRLENGDTVLVVQEADVSFAPGNRVRVITGPDGTARVTGATGSVSADNQIKGG